MKSLKSFAIQNYENAFHSVPLYATCCEGKKYLRNQIVDYKCDLAILAFLSLFHHSGMERSLAGFLIIMAIANK